MLECGFKITRERQGSHYEMKREHSHDYYEFYYLMSGSRKFFLNNTIYHIFPGDLIVIPKGEIHRTSFFSTPLEESLENERVVFCFTDSYISSFIHELGNEFETCFLSRLVTIPANRREYLEGLFDKLLVESHGVDHFSQKLCHIYCEEILLFIIRCQKYSKSQETTLPIADKEMEEAAYFISSHLNENISLTLMAERCCMSNSYFSKRFKHVTGFGFKEYQNAVRIRHACDLLLTTDLSVTQISEKCGFTDSNYFGDAFRKAKKMSPREYRKANLVK